jgi:hypothetical protein
MDSEFKNKHFNTLVELANERNLKYYAWLRQILLMASGLIGILVSLKNTKSENSIEHLAFVTTIISLGIGILAGSIVLFSEIKNLEKKKVLYSQHVQKLINGDTKVSGLIYFNTGKFYQYIEYVSYFSLILSLIGLMVYAILLD